MIEEYVSIPHSTYDEWRSNTIGVAYNPDHFAGAQCWDYIAELYFNLGFGTGYPHTGPNLAAYECWTVSRYQNLGTQSIGQKFELVELLATVKRGDIVVLNQGRFPGDTTGHIAFADEDYDGSGQMWLLGQNQVNPNPTTGSPVARTRMSVTAFLGAFRNKEWQTTPTPTTQKSKFPWVLYARKLNKSRRNII